MVSAGIQKLVMKDKDCIKLMVNDTFQSKQFKEKYALW